MTSFPTTASALLSTAARSVKSQLAASSTPIPSPTSRYSHPSGDVVDLLLHTDLVNQLRLICFLSLCQTAATLLNERELKSPATACSILSTSSAALYRMPTSVSCLVCRIKRHHLSVQTALGRPAAHVTNCSAVVLVSNFCLVGLLNDRRPLGQDEHRGLTDLLSCRLLIRPVAYSGLVGLSFTPTAVSGIVALLYRQNLCVHVALHCPAANLIHCRRR